MLDAVVDFGAGLRRWRTSYTLALQDIELKYKRSFLGPFWISASLVVTVLALAFVFAEVFKQEFAHYVSFVGAGLLGWQLITALISEGCGSIVEHGTFLQNVRMPMSVIAGRIVIRNAIIFAHNFVAMIGMLVLLGATPHWTMLMVFPGAAAILLFGYFIVIVMGPLCARFRDVPLIVGSLLQVIFFLTPIFWMPSAASHRPMFTHANPFFHLVEIVRAPLLGDPASPLNWQVASWCCAVAAVGAVISISLTRKRLNLWL